MKPRVLLLQPASYPSRAQDFGVPHLLALAGWVEREAAVEPVVRDLRHERDPDRALREALAEARPLLVGISCYASFDYLDAVAAARKVKEAAPGTPIVAGGYHASACPEDFTRHGDLFDHVVVGDGERPLADLVRSLRGGGAQPPPVIVAGRPLEPGELPPYPFHLLERYRRVAAGGRVKLQVNLSRGCPHACTFCMERAKPDRVWRALPPERAVDELRRLDRVFPFGDHLLHVTDPLFGMKSEWRREFLERFAASGLRPRSAWTLTRAEGWDDDELRLAARGRLSLGIGLESGSPAMLRTMRKTGRPEAYLEGFLRLRERAERTGTTWAVNVLVGHPGESAETMRESLEFLERLFPPGAPTRGWLSVDPFRLYPGSDVHRRMAAWSAEHGARFHAPDWWTRAADRDVTAELVDPSATLDVFARLDAMFARYRATALRVADSFRCADPEAAPIFARSLDEQRDAFSPEMYERRRRIFAERHPAARLPAGAPRGVPPAIERVEGDGGFARAAARALGLSAGARCAVVGPRSPAIEAVLREAVGAGGAVVRVPPPGRLARLVKRLAAAAGRRRAGGGEALRLRAARVAAAVLPGAHAAVPRSLLAWLRARPGRRAVVAVGPRFRDQRVVLVSSTPEGVRRRTIGVGRFAPARGEGGWEA